MEVSLGLLPEGYLKISVEIRFGLWFYPKHVSVMLDFTT